MALTNKLNNLKITLEIVIDRQNIELKDINKIYRNKTLIDLSNTYSLEANGVKIAEGMIVEHNGGWGFRITATL